MSHDRRYYRIWPESPVMDVIREAEQRQSKFREAAKKLAHDFDATVWSSDNTYVLGLEFKGEIPTGWRKGKHEYAVPNKRVKAGRDAAELINGLPTGVDCRRFSYMLNEAVGENYEHWSDHFVYWTNYEKRAGVYILSVPAQCLVTPPKCTELLMSEYWQLREADKKEAKA